MGRRVAGVASLAFALALVGGVARADKMTDAEELFRRGKALMGEGKHREACPLFEESNKLDPQMGTLLNLAICHENVGRVASAWGEFRAVEQQARAANRDDRVKLAHDRAQKLEPRLSRLRIVTSGDAHPAGLVVKVDGETKGEPLWNGIAVDPGIRVVEASAPGKKPASLKVRVEEEGATVSVTIPKLADAPVAPPPPPPGATGPTEREAYAANRSRRTTGLVIGGIGLTAAVVGGVFGGLAIANDGDAVSSCPKPCFAGSPEARAADEKTDRALVFANVTNVVLPIGLVVGAIGAYMFLSAGPTEASAARPAPRVAAGPSAIGLRW